MSWLDVSTFHVIYVCASLQVRCMQVVMDDFGDILDMSWLTQERSVDNCQPNFDVNADFGGNEIFGGVTSLEKKGGSEEG